MRVITCASYYGTGSSAVTDFFTEFDGIHSLGDYEYRFLHEPDGIADLEYNLVENNNRHNTSDAIKRFMRYMRVNKQQGYGGYDIFGDAYEKLTERYLDEIVELKARSWWNKDRTDKGKLFGYVDRAYSLAKRITTGNLRSEKRFSLLQKTEYGYYSAISEEEFLTATRRYITDLLQSVNTEKAPFMMVDQIVPPTNTKRYQRYFDDIRIIVVDRDPRDLYLLEKDVWQWGVIPVQNVEEFIKWFKITRKYADSQLDDPSCVLRIRFEDMIFHYEETSKCLMDFVGVDASAHVRPGTVFDPAKSVKNTRLYERIPGYEEDIKRIEEELGVYLYNQENRDSSGK